MSKFNQFPDYQSLESGSQGAPAKANRSIPDRVKDYDLMNYITPTAKVLDLGCNRGFFGVYLSPNIHSYVGIDSDANQIHYGVNEISKRRIKNMTLHNREFFCINQKFDVILCLSFHSYVGISMWEFAKCLMDMLNPKGYLFLEGHPRGYREEPDKYWNPLTSYLYQNLIEIKSKFVTDRELKRPFVLFQK